MACGTGDRVGPYEIRELLGAGGMGRVFRAFDARLERDVALKFLEAGTADGDDAATKRLLREARAASALNHPHVCRIYDVGTSEHGPWIAMEYVAGEPLDRCIAPHGLPIASALAAGRQIASALAHAHQRGIVHRDLKSANCISGPDGHVTVLDFGLAGRSPERMAEEATRTRSLPGDGPAGTPAYMAPEVLGGSRADARADLWALGVILYELACGRRPFAAASTFELASAILTHQPAPLPSSIPSAYRQTVFKLLEKNPADRYQTAAEVQTALTVDSAVLSSDGPRSTGSRLTRRAVVASAAIVLAAGAVWWTVGRNRPLALTDLQLLSTAQGSHSSPSLSPDGSNVAFVAADGAGVPQVWIRSRLAGDATPLTSGPAAAQRPRWLPDASGIVYARADGGIWRVPPLAGNPSRVVERGTNPHVALGGAAMTWETAEGIWIGGVDGSAARLVGGVQRRYYSVPRWPALSPDGRFIAYFHAELGPNGDFWMIPAEGGEPKRLTSDLREGGAPAWTPDGHRIIVSSARAGSRTLWQIPVEGGEPFPLTTGVGEDDSPELSADGTRLVFTNTRHSWDIRLAPLDGGERVVLQRRTELLFPRFSPDGTRLTFFGRSGRAVAIFNMARDGSDVRQLTEGTDLNHHPRWSGDGGSIFFYQASPSPGLRRVPAVGGPSVEIFPWIWEVENGVDFAADGERLVYSRFRPLGRTSAQEELTFVRTLGAGREITLPRPHLHNARFSHDGRSIAGFRHDSSIGICDAEGEACRGIAADATMGALAWTADDLRLLFFRSRSREGPQQVWSLGIDGSDARHVRDIGPFAGIARHFDLSIAGELVWAPIERGRSEIWTATIR